LFIFLITDKSDEFQLVQFILLFKGTQFISHGIIKTAIGFFTYVGCTAAASEDFNNWDHKCEISGPGVTKGWKVFEIMFGGWVLQILLVWTAFFMLPCSSDKARKEIRGPDSETQEQLDDYQCNGDGELGAEKKPSRIRSEAAVNGGWSAGGKIRYLLFWDMSAFLASVAVMAWIMSTRPYFDWVVIHTFFACQVLYGYMAMPFFIFCIPMLREALTHSVPSAYDKEGRVRAYEAPPPKDEALLKKQLEWLEEERKKAHPEEVEKEHDSGLGDLLHTLKTMIVSVFGFVKEEEEDKDKEEKKEGGVLQSVGNALSSRFHMPGLSSPKHSADTEVEVNVKTSVA